MQLTSRRTAGFRPWVLLVALLAGAVAVLAADSSPQTHTNKLGVHSAEFDEKYIAPSDTFLTPETHPSLFTFAGRWARHRDIYKASRWPGNSVTVLVYGDHCTFKLRPEMLSTEQRQLKYSMSVDDGPEFDVNLDILVRDVNMVPPVTIAVVLEGLDGLSEAEKAARLKQRKPHVVRLTSLQETPLTLMGVYVPTSLVKQDMQWRHAQLARPYVEFVGGAAHPLGSDFVNAPEFRAADALRYRHAHVTDDVCLAPGCGKTKPLVEQYPYADPLYDNDPHYKAYLVHSGLYGFSENAILQPTTPEFVFLNVGDNDAAAAVPAANYTESLFELLKFVRTKAHPDAHIFIVVKPGRYAEETQSVVRYVADPRIVAVAYPQPDDAAGWERLLCMSVNPLLSPERREPSAAVCGKYSGLPAYTISTADLAEATVAAASSQIYVLTVITLALVAMVLLRDVIRRAAMKLLVVAGVVAPRKGFGLASLTEKSSELARGSSH
ncbi:uncharacterized protein V1510DRAFT_360696 [Dipodascopsis tothii]|uniref:uncharacterized protein n=1 Tax=Dipodascopsis tothii TaxID=44089 RepID=UPI0034CE24AE